MHILSLIFFSIYERAQVPFAGRVFESAELDNPTIYFFW